MSRKKNKCFGEQGAFSIYMATFLSLIIAVTVPLFIKTHTHSINHSISQIRDVKTLLTARSGIWYAVEGIKNELDRDTLMADTAVLQSEDAFTDTAVKRGRESFLTGDSLKKEPFDSIEQGTFSLCTSVKGPFLKIVSTGSYRDGIVRVKAYLGTRLFSSADTMLCIKTGSLPQGSGFVSGETVLLHEATENCRKRFRISRKEFERSISEKREIISSMKMNNIPETPVNVTSTSELQNVPDTVNSSLFIDGMAEDISGSLASETYVLEDFQVTGDVELKNSKIVCAKDIKILDNVRLVNCELFTSARFFISGEASFSGSCTAMGDIEIFENAVIENRSTFISAGKAKRGKKKNRKIFSLFIRDNAQTDGVFIELRKNGGIFTSKNSLLKGILWSPNTVEHNGVIEGAVFAGKLTSEELADTVESNYLDGEIKGLDRIGEYLLPYYIGQPELLKTEEY